MIEEIHIEHDLLEAQRVAAIALKEIKETELDLRNQITDVLLKGKPTGTHNFIMEGFKIKVVKSVTHSFDTEGLEQLMDNNELSEDELTLLRVKYSLILDDYKQAAFDTTVLDDVIIVKPSLPTLSITIGE